MSKANGKPPGRPPYRHNKTALPEPGDAQGAYTHAQLLRFDNRFRARVLRAFKREACRLSLSRLSGQTECRTARRCWYFSRQRTFGDRNQR